MPVKRTLANTALSVLVLSIFAATIALAIDTEIDAKGLRAKYGPPLARDTFIVPAGEMVVDYAPDGNVCGIQLPAVAPDKSHSGTKSTKAMDDFILDLIPLTFRGKELRRFVMSAGAPRASVVEYENVTIAEAFQGELRTGMTITFKGEKCKDRRVQQQL